MNVDIEALLSLWSEEPPPGTDAEEAFRRFYADPVTVNGVPLTAGQLVARAEALRNTFEDPSREVLEVCAAADKVAVAFRLSGRQTGPLATSAGVLAPTGRVVTLRVIDILTVVGGRITDVVMVADELGALAAIDAVSLADGGAAAGTAPPSIPR